jgi:hypothetical protein
MHVLLIKQKLIQIIIIKTIVNNEYSPLDIHTYIVNHWKFNYNYFYFVLRDK